MNIGKNLKRLRLERNLSLKTVAEALDIAVSTLSDYERNVCDPSLSRFFSIMDFYNIEPINFLKNGEEYIRITDYSEVNKQKIYKIDKIENSQKHNK